MRPHRTDGVSLSFGILFLLVAIWWAVTQVMSVRLPAVGWLVAGGLIAFGVIGLLGALQSNRRAVVDRHVPAAEPAPEPAVEVPGDLPPEMHASIVRELLDDPALRFAKEHPDLRADRAPDLQPDRAQQDLHAEKPQPDFLAEKPQSTLQPEESQENLQAEKPHQDLAADRHEGPEKG